MIGSVVVKEHFKRTSSTQQTRQCGTNNIAIGKIFPMVTVYRIAKPLFKKDK